MYKRQYVDAIPLHLDIIVKVSAQPEAIQAAPSSQQLDAKQVLTSSLRQAVQGAGHRGRQLFRVAGDSWEGAHKPWGLPLDWLMDWLKRNFGKK